jgi:hypothetical protein
MKLVFRRKSRAGKNVSRLLSADGINAMELEEFTKRVTGERAEFQRLSTHPFQ